MTTRSKFLPPNQEYWGKLLASDESIIGFGKSMEKLEGPTTRAFQEVMRDVLGSSQEKTKDSHIDPIKDISTITGPDAEDDQKKKLSSVAIKRRPPKRKISPLDKPFGNPKVLTRAATQKSIKGNAPPSKVQPVSNNLKSDALGPWLNAQP